MNNMLNAQSMNNI